MAAQISSTALNRLIEETEMKSGLKLLTDLDQIGNIGVVEFVISPFGGCIGIDADYDNHSTTVSTSGLSGTSDPRRLKDLIDEIIEIIEERSISNLLVCCTESLLLWNDPVVVSNEFKRLDDFCKTKFVIGYVLLRENLVSARDFQVVCESLSS